MYIILYYVCIRINDYIDNVPIGYLLCELNNYVIRTRCELPSGQQLLYDRGIRDKYEW